MFDRESRAHRRVALSRGGGGRHELASCHRTRCRLDRYGWSKLGGLARQGDSAAIAIASVSSLVRAHTTADAVTIALRRRIGARLRQCREVRGLSQEAVVDALFERTKDRVGKSRQTLSSWENGHTLPGADALAALAGIYGASTDYLCGLVDDKTGLPVGDCIVDAGTHRAILAASSEQELLRRADRDAAPFTWWFRVPRDAKIVDERERYDMEIAVNDKVRSLSPRFETVWLRTIIDSRRRRGAHGFVDRDDEDASR